MLSEIPSNSTTPSVGVFNSPPDSIPSSNNQFNDILKAYNDDSVEVSHQQQESLSWYVYVISGYCDSPLANVERLPIEHSQFVSGFENQKEQSW